MHTHSTITYYRCLIYCSQTWTHSHMTDTHAEPTIKATTVDTTELGKGEQLHIWPAGWLVCWHGNSHHADAQRDDPFCYYRLGLAQRVCFQTKLDLGPAENKKKQKKHWLCMRSFSYIRWITLGDETHSLMHMLSHFSPLSCNVCVAIIFHMKAASQETNLTSHVTSQQVHGFDISPYTYSYHWFIFF